jgi:hypothetical protein
MKILVVEASALHLGFIGCYGNEWVATPNLDRLAAEGIVFDQHIADGCRPEPGPGIHIAKISGVDDFARQALRTIRSAVAADPATLWIEGPDLTPPWRLPADLLTSYAEEETDEPPLTDPEAGLTPLDSDSFARLQATYAAVVTCFDAQLGRVIDHLPENGQLDQLLFGVTARYGLPLGEHGLTGMARAWLHEELVHLPLIIRLPGGEHAGSRVGALTQPADLLPTFREFLGVDPETSQGHSVWPVIRGAAESVRPYAVSTCRIGESEEWLLRTPDRAFLLPIGIPESDPPRRPQLFVKPDNRWEVNNLAQREDERVAGLEKTLRDCVKMVKEGGPVRYPPLPEDTSAVPVETA